MDNEVMKSNRISLLKQLSFYHAIFEWKYKPSTRLMHYFPESIKNLYKSQNVNILKDLKMTIVKSLITQYFVYLYELVDDNFDESLKKSKKEFSKIKLNIDVNGNLKSVNAAQLFDVIRQSFAHNDDENLVPHWMWDENNNIIIHRKLKQGEIELKINIDELISLANIYLTNALKEPRPAVSMYANRLSNAVMQKRLNPFNVHKYVGSFDIETKTDIPLDKYQKLALYNFIMQNSQGLDEHMIKMGIHPYDPSLLVLKYPFKCNANNALKDCQKTIDYLSLLNETTLTRNGFMHKVFDKKVEKGEPVDVIEIQDFLGVPGRFEACLANNLLFTIFTYMEPSKIKQYMRDELDLNKIRNSIMHGRFYYNYESGFNFYDGIINKKDKNKTIKEIEKNVEYIGTITTQEIDALAMKLLHDYIEEKIMNESKR